MIFEIGKTYRHNSGKIMTIIGRLKTHIYGECLIGECDTGELIPVGESEDNTVNWQMIGHWIKEETIYGWDGKSYQCSACGRSIHLDVKMEDLRDYPYCHCGCRMIDSQEGESTEGASE